MKIDEMDGTIADAVGAPGIEKEVNGKPALPDSMEEHEEAHEVQANGDHSGESDVINPPEEAGGESTSHLDGKKPRPAKVSFVVVFYDRLATLLCSLLFLYDVMLGNPKSWS